MASPVDIPPALRHRPFTTFEALGADISATSLRHKRFRRLYRGVWICAEVELTLVTRIRAALLVLPGDAVVSHTTALALRGIELGDPSTLHFSTNTGLRAWHEGITLHRRIGWLNPSLIDGIRVVGPDRALVDSTGELDFRDLVRAGDALCRRGDTTPARLRAYADERHLDGVQRARLAAPHVRAGVDSIMETDVRLLLRFARLPEPEVNGWIVARNSAVIGRGDLVYRAYRVIVEYDGWHHERDARQRQKDHLRRERLEAEGWTVIVITSADLADPLRIVRRVHAALVAHGYTGWAPVMSDVWRRWFTTV